MSLWSLGLAEPLDNSWQLLGEPSGVGKNKKEKVRERREELLTDLYVSNP